MKKYFYLWAFLDINHTGRFADTFFCKNSKEATSKNLNMLRTLSLILCIVSLIVIGMCLTFMNIPALVSVYTGIFVMEIMFFALAMILQKKEHVAVSNVLSSIFLLHLLIIGGIIGTVYSPTESALVYVVVLVIAQMIFILPPLLTTFLQGLSLAFTWCMSYHIKSPLFFWSDIMNCVGVFVLSILLGWYITKIRIEEVEARSKAVELAAELKALSVTDQLTTLHNHRSFQDTFYKTFKQLSDTNQPMGVIMLDIDKFKNYNDHYGHLEGDHCLNAIGRCFAKFQSENVQPFRFGGEEFVVLLTDNACAQIKELTEDLRREIESLSIPHAYSPAAEVVTVSVGYYLGYPKSTNMPMELVDAADQALYKSKAAGGNVVTGSAEETVA